MGRRRSPTQDAPLRQAECEVCQRPGIAGADVFPYWWGPPIGHKWCHQSCAERYRVALVAAQRRRAVEGSKPGATAMDRQLAESRGGAVQKDMARKVIQTRRETNRSWS